MCTQSWDGEHDWEEVGDEAHPDHPDDEDSRIVPGRVAPLMQYPRPVCPHPEWPYGLPPTMPRHSNGEDRARQGW